MRQRLAPVIAVETLGLAPEIEQQRLQTDPERRKALVQEANKITSDKVASAFVFHQMDILVHHNSVNFPPESRIPGLVDLDRTTVS